MSSKIVLDLDYPSRGQFCGNVLTRGHGYSKEYRFLRPNDFYIGSRRNKGGCPTLEIGAPDNGITEP